VMVLRLATVLVRIDIVAISRMPPLLFQRRVR
jgi:hypothetical protein